jgi:CRP-like cAMP-binding protein
MDRTISFNCAVTLTAAHPASVIVVSTPTELVFINRVVFSELLKESHDSSTHTLEVTKRFRSNKDIVRNIFMRSSTQRSEKDLKFAVEYLKSVKFFSRFSFEVRKQLCKVMRLISAVSNTVLFAEGQVGRHFYIIFTGCVDVSVRAKNRFEETKENVVSRLGEGEYFGELALSQADGVRRATVVCTEFCELLVLARDEYEPLIKKYQNEYHAQYAQMLRKNPYFVGPEWDDNTIEGMCSVMTEKYIPFKGEICKQVGSCRSTMLVLVADRRVAGVAGISSGRTLHCNPRRVSDHPRRQTPDHQRTPSVRAGTIRPEFSLGVCRVGWLWYLLPLGFTAAKLTCFLPAGPQRGDSTTFSSASTPSWPSRP